MNDKEYKFTGRVVRSTYNTPDFKIYAIDVDQKKYPDIQINKYNNVTILGDLPDLTIDVEYEIIAVEQTTKYGISYKVLNVKRDLPTKGEDIYLFLREILTPNQAKVLYEVYPDIIDRVKENKLDDIDFNKLHGIGKYTFNVIKNKIVENFCLADLVIEFQGYLNLSIIKKIYDKYSSIEVLKKKLKQDPYKCLCGISGIGFKTADGLLLDIEKASKNNIKNGKKPIIEFESDLKTSKQRCLACVLYLLSENENNGHTKMNLAELRAECLRSVPDCSHHFVEAVKDDTIYYNKETMDVSLRYTYEIERKIAQRLLANLKMDEKDYWNFDVDKYRNVDNFMLSDEQMDIVNGILNNRILMLIGGAGVGKSSSVSAVINMLEDNCKTYMLLAPTGKASKVISEYTHKQASTIHRALGYQPTNKLAYNEENKLSVDVVIVDEFSMVDIFLFDHLLDAIDFSRTRLLIIGDDAQLPSVSCGNLLYDFINSKKIYTSTLTKVFRYGEGGLMQVATKIRFSQPYLSKEMQSKATSFGNNKDYTFVDLQSEVIPRNTVALYKKLLDDGYTINDIQVLTAKKVGSCGTNVLNNALQKVANKNYGSEENIVIGETTYYVGDLVIQMVNNYKALIYDDNNNNPFSDDECTGETAFVANGETGIIKKIERNHVIIDFDGISVVYAKSDMLSVKLGYAITTHKSQGSSSKIIIFTTPRSDTFMLNSNLIYVGLTRTKERCYHLGSLATVNMAVKKKANLDRHTFMLYLLQNLTEEECKEIKNKSKEITEEVVTESIDVVDFNDYETKYNTEEDLPFY